MPQTPILLSNGLVVDGTGAAGVRGDILVRDGRIAAVEPAGAISDHIEGVEVVDCSDHVIAPGFIDIHTHSDLTRLVYPDAATRALQGVTTEVTGNCGMSPAPMPRTLSELRAIIGPIDVCPQVEFTWTDMASYLDTMSTSDGATNVVPLLGHGTLRQWAAGAGTDGLDRSTLQKMAECVEEALDLGYWGMSLGLMYAPGELAGEDELAELAGVLARRGALMAAHMRSYGASTVLDAVSEVAAIVRRTEVAFEISHLRTIGDVACESMNQVIALLDQLGLDIEADAYPYLAGQTTLQQMLPAALRSTGTEAILAAMRSDRDAVTHRLRQQPVQPGNITIARTGDTLTSSVGRTLLELSETTGQDWAAVVVQLLLDFDGAVDIIAVGSTVDDTMRSLSDPRVSIGSDGVSLDLSHTANLPHPRSIGTFPRAIRMLLDHGVTLESAIHKATGKPAARIGLTDRGRIAPGLVADLVTLRLPELADNATYLKPLVAPSGVCDVYVAGTAVVRSGAPTGQRPGALIRRQ
jgi:N-acyl-D-aspartate/D-glutamate deacylase